MAEVGCWLWMFFQAFGSYLLEEKNEFPMINLFFTNELPLVVFRVLLPTPKNHLRDNVNL